ncbi:sarcosine oxidase subunit gamma [Paracoccus saliphilus]|uniref:Sarcosine oxidase subunit gamma n=1 Tax=Paracoccus saliphilus TaxID=405559 RepID=A0AA46A6T8_9RHOB|nr:sarcosine oxidase subunit gamma family protein [Paracoccus saliphilus]WCR02899.1 sarcosine oxidase subunit gamma [Paracoccus saliphilus]SIT03205.1 sarcosine oxidase subunit gamma [Paracoccus saliphilus]
MAEAVATVTPVEGLGMITIRADLSCAGDAIAEAVGLVIPETLRIVTDGSRSLGWMSPDELLLVLPAQETAETLVALEQALTGEHALVADMSDARAVFDVTGPHAEDVIAKLCPADPVALPSDGLRRTRAAQTAAAFWQIESGFRMIGFRSTADYLGLVLRNAAIPGSQLAPR